MNVTELINKTCDRGLKSAQEVEKGAKLEGAIEGFEMARRVKDIESLFALLAQVRDDTRYYRGLYDKQVGTLDDYWRARYAELQVEFVYEVVNVGLHFKPTASARAMKVYAEIVGVKDVDL